jgi:acetolactate synthase-1/2/3 large subunit
MGYALPAAIGAKLAKPHRQVVCVCGDGSFQMSMCELATLKQTGADVKIILMVNERLGMVWELQTKLYDGRHNATTLTGSPDFVKLAEAYGIPAAEVSSNAQAELAAKRMLESDGPFLLVCRVDPDEQTL